MLTPAKDDPNRDKELTRRKAQPSAFGQPIIRENGSRDMTGQRLVTAETLAARSKKNAPKGE